MSAIVPSAKLRNIFAVTMQSKQSFSEEKVIGMRLFNGKIGQASTTLGL